MPENTKRSGCGCGGCLLFCFYTVIIFLGGMYLSNLIDRDWDLEQAKDKLVHDSATIGNIVKDKATKLITGEDILNPADTDLAVSALIQAGDKSYNKAMELLKQASEASGDEQQKLLHELQGELQKSLNLYQAAAAKDQNNPKLPKKISHLKDLLAKMKP